MLKISVSQTHIITNKLGNNEGTTTSGTNNNDFGFRPGSNEKLFKSRKSTISNNSGAIEELKFLTSDARGDYNLLQ